MPECALNLSQAAVYLALAPKSNASYRAIGRARKDVRELGAEMPPSYLQDAHYPGARKLGRGIGYEYPHELPGRRFGAANASRGASGPPLLRADDRGFEAKLRNALQHCGKGCARPAS